MKKWISPSNLSPQLLLLLISITVFPCVYGQVTVFSDAFNTNTSATYTTSGPIGASAWTVSRSGDDWGARRNTSPQQLELTNDVGVTANADGFVLASTPTSAFSNPYNTTLSAGGVVTWTFNMRQIQADPDGFDLVTSYGVAFILAGTSNTTRTTGSGYAVVLGQAGTTDPVRLVSYATGLSSAVNMVTSNTTGLTDIGANYLSIKVTYNPCDNNKWEFFLRNDGLSAFGNPLSGTPPVSQGTSNNADNIGSSLPILAAYWQGASDAVRTAFFDNVTVTVLSKPSITPGNNPIVCTGATVAAIQYSNAVGNPNQYSIDWSASANSAGFVDVVNQTLSPVQIVVAVPIAALPNMYHGSLTVRNSSNLCVSDVFDIVVVVVPCTPPPPSTFRWIFLPNNYEESPTCISTSDCNTDMLCFGLEYTPLYTGDMTTYTSGFFVNCDNMTNPVLSNMACVLNDNSEIHDQCIASNQVLFNSSTDSGDPVPVVKGLSKIIHQVCFSIPDASILVVNRDPTAGTLTVGIDSAGTGGPETDVIANYFPLTIDSLVACLTLPVKWLSFNAVRYGDRMSQLDWSTTEEVNNSYFEIQRSTDNGQTFQRIGKVNATPVSQAVNHYRFIDLHAANGENFYRLKQVDFDNKWALSPIRIVSFEGNKNNFSINAWPNPVSDILTIDVQDAAEPFHMTLVDLSGRIVWKGAFEPGSSVQLVDVASFGAGVYSLIAEGNSVRDVEKVVVIR